jgi:hypothetical protein
MAIDPIREHWWWRVAPTEPGPVVVVDIDGVIADAQGRQYLLEGSRADWEAFFAACGDDPVVVEVRTLLSLLNEAVGVLLVTARPIRTRDLTIAWLTEHALRWDLLVMRPAREFAPAVLFKRDVVDELRGEGFELALAIEDDPDIKEMYVDAGVPCLYLHSGYYE